MSKEQNDEKILKTMRSREQVLIQTRNTNMMKNNIEKGTHVENLGKWVARGFSTSRSTKKTINAKLERLSRVVQSPVKVKDETVEAII